MRPPRRKELTRDVVDNNGVIDPQETQVEELEDTLFKDGCSELKRYLNPRLMKFKRNVANYYVYLDCNYINDIIIHSKNYDFQLR
jgi:hypothetical protein